MNTPYVYEQLIAFIRHEVQNRGFSRVIFGLSGGIDSAVVALLALKALGKENIKGILMPSDTSSQSSTDDALELAGVHSFETEILPIGPMLTNYTLPMTPLRRGNMSARLRMLTLFDISLRDNALVLGTGNRSEILLGYGTLYGDTACSLNPIGNLYKCEVYELARYLGITEAILTKAPSADLWEGQSDEVELGYSYAALDPVMMALFDEKKTIEEVIFAGTDEKMVKLIQERYERNRFKGEMPPIASVIK